VIRGREAGPGLSPSRDQHAGLCGLVSQDLSPYWPHGLNCRLIVG